MEDVCPVYGATDTLVLDYWCHLPWVLKPGWICCLQTFLFAWHSSDSPLQELLTVCGPAWQLSLFGPHTCSYQTYWWSLGQGSKPWPTMPQHSTPNHSVLDGLLRVSTQALLHCYSLDVFYLCNRPLVPMIGYYVCSWARVISSSVRYCCLMYKAPWTTSCTSLSYRTLNSLFALHCIWSKYLVKPKCNWLWDQSWSLAVQSVGSCEATNL